MRSRVAQREKRAVKRAIDGDKAVPTELRGEARQLHHESEMDVLPINGENGNKVIDDEYAQVGLREPHVCVTTSRDPSSRLKQFAKEVKIMLPNSQNINRGNTRVDELIRSCRQADFTDVVVLVETWQSRWYDYLSFAVWTNRLLHIIQYNGHDIPECQQASQAHPHLILDGLDSKLVSESLEFYRLCTPSPARRVAG